MKKRKKRRITATAALMWRVCAMVFGLWLAAMSYITVIAAQDIYDQCEEHVTLFGIPGDSVAAQRLQMLDNRIYLDLRGDTHTELPFYEGSDQEMDYETAMIFLDASGKEILNQGDYATLSYIDEPTWYSGETKICGKTYIDLSKTGYGRSLVEAYGGVPHTRYPVLPLATMGRYTGYFEDGEFILLAVHTFAGHKVTIYDPEGQLIDGQLDKEGMIAWTEVFDDTAQTDRELIRLYSDSLYVYGTHSEPVTADGRRFDALEDLLRGYLQGDETLASRSLWDAVIVRTGTYTDTEGELCRYGAALHCHPMKTAMLRLTHFYLITLIPVVVLVLLFWLRIRRELAAPLRQLVRYGRMDLAPLPDTMEPCWQEPYELEQGYVQTQRKVHELKKEDKQLSTALEFAQNAEASRRQMISNITHELKTPLAVIHSYAEGLAEGIAAEKQEQYLKVILEEAERMDAMVLEMLDFSRLEAGKVRLASDRFSLITLTRTIFDKLEPLIGEKGLRLHYGLTEDIQITADESRIAQVIGNFATNAIKYTPDGGNIWVNVYRHKEKALFSIENECEPLSEDALEKVWESFYRAETSRTSKGTGLGLTIAKTIIDLHGGTCQAQNTQAGVRFQFTLP